MEIYILQDVEDGEIIGVYNTLKEAEDVANSTCVYCNIKKWNTNTQEEKFIGNNINFSLF